MPNKKQIDYDSLTREQKNVAEQVYLAAEKYGLNPDFVLPLAYAESGFIQKAKSDYGAKGVMQISEDTAKRYKCDPTDLADNIDCGMRIIKSHIDNPKIGNDPYKVVIAYNTRSDTLNKFLDAYNSDPDHPEKHLHLLPEATQTHIANIEDYYGGNLPHASVGETAKDAETTAGNEPPKVDTSNDFKDSQKTIDAAADAEQKKANIERASAAGYGALAGAGLGTGAASVQGVADVSSAVLNALRNQQMPTQEVAPTQAPVEPSAPVDTRTPGEKWNKTGYGVGTGSVRDVSSRFQRIAPDPESKIASKYVKKFGSEALRQAEEQAAKDAFWSKHIAEVDRLNAAQQAAKQAPKVAPVAQAASDVYPTFSKAMKGLSYLKYPVVGGLTGLGIGSGLADTYNRFKKGDESGASLSALGTALTAAQPFLGGLAGLSAGAGSLGIPLYLAAGDRLEHLQRHPEDYQLAPNDYDAMGNPLQ
jgi:hypothetical protein